ncbi:MAG: hypothetical protein HY960_13510 [Ignavibacteriae bacterium]|nr:hypothetical protein [Ignavibacteriota bacterium]
MKKSERIIYSLTVEDVQNVAEEVLGRTLTTKEISCVEESVGDSIDWFGVIEEAIHKHIKIEDEE